MTNTLVTITGFLSLVGRLEQKTSRSRQDENCSQSSSSQGWSQKASCGGLVIGRHNARRLGALKSSSEAPKPVHGSETPQWRKVVRKPQLHRKRQEAQSGASMLLATVWCCSDGAHKPRRGAGLGADQAVHFCLQTGRTSACYCTGRAEAKTITLVIKV